MTSLFGSGPAPVAAPTPLPPPTMPDPNSPATIAAAQMKSQQDAMRSGRSASILTTAGGRAPATIAGGALGAGKASQGAGTAAPAFSNTSL